MMHIRFVCQATSIILLLACSFASTVFAQTTGPASAQPGKRIAARLTYQVDPATNGPVVVARLNDKVDAHLLLDTGSNFSIISDSIAARLGLTPKPLVRSTGEPVLFNEQAVNVVFMNTRLGDLVLTGYSMVLPAKQIHDTTRSYNDGLIGLNVISAASVFFDFPHKQVTFFSPHDLTAEQFKQMGLSDVPSLPNTSKVDLLFSVPITINNTVHTDLFVDTGTPRTDIPAEALKSLQLTPLQRDLIYSNFYGSANVNLVKVKTFAAGSLTLPDLSLYTWDHAPEGTQPHIGMDVLSRCRMLIDYTAKKLYLKSVAPGKSDLNSSRLSVILPMEQLKNTRIPCLRLALENNKSYLFALELELTASYLDRSIGEQTQLPIKSEKDDIGNVAEALRTTILPVAAPDATDFPDFPYMQLPIFMGDLSATRNLYPEVAGILGTNVFQQSAWSLDFSKKQITFVHSGSLQNTPQELKGTKRLPLTLEKGLMNVEVMVDGKPTRFVLSSYNETTLRSPKTIATLKPVGRLQHTHTADGKPDAESSVRLREIKIGASVWKQPVVTQILSDDKNAPNMLGLDFLSRFRVTLDAPAQSWYLEPDPAYKEQPDSRVGLGFTPRIAVDKNLEILSLDLESPAAEAGLKVGDVITTINGLPVQTTPIQKIQGEVQHKPAGTVIALVVQPKGGDKPRNVTLKIRKLL